MDTISSYYHAHSLPAEYRQHALTLIQARLGYEDAQVGVLRTPTELEQIGMDSDYWSAYYQWSLYLEQLGR